MRAIIPHTATSLLRLVPESKTAERAKRERGEGRHGYRLGLRAVLPLLPAVLAFGVSFGVLAQAAGMGASASIVMSLTTFAGSAQFAVVSVLGAGGGLYVGWTGGTAIGVVAGDSLADPATLGLDAAFPALFLALLAPLLKNRNALAAALLGAGIAICLTPITPAGIPVIAATAACLVGLRRPAAASAPSYGERSPAAQDQPGTERAAA